MRVNKGRTILVAAWILILTGAALRIYHFLINRSLWLDEAMLAVNIVQRSPANLLLPLDYAQGAPWGFLLVQKLMVDTGGANEYALRVFPLAASLVAVPTYYLQSKRYGSRSVALAALALLSFSYFQIYYASEVKQYSVDVLVCILLLLFGHDLLADQFRSKAAWRFAALTSVVMWFSHPAVFVAAGLYVASAAKLALRHHWKGTVQILGAAAVSAAIFSVLYIVSLRGLASNSTLTNFWSFGYMPFPPWRDLPWFWTSYRSFFITPAGPLGLAAEILLLLGAAVLAWRRPDYAAVYLLPFAFVLTASALHVYPFADRLVLVLTPLAFFLIAYGATWLAAQVPIASLRPAAWLILVLACLVPSVQIDLDRIAWPYPREHIRPALEYLARNLTEGDTLYAYRMVFPTIEFYADRYGIDLGSIIAGKYYGNASLVTDSMSLDELQALRGRKRAWVIIARPYRNGTVDDETRIVDYLDTFGSVREEYDMMGVAIYLFESDR